jgi:hypothetical protein
VGYALDKKDQDQSSNKSAVKNRKRVRKKRKRLRRVGQNIRKPCF